LVLGQRNFVISQGRIIIVHTHYRINNNSRAVIQNKGITPVKTWGNAAKGIAVLGVFAKAAIDSCPDKPKDWALAALIKAAVDSNTAVAEIRGVYIFITCKCKGKFGINRALITFFYLNCNDFNGCD